MASGHCTFSRHIPRLRIDALPPHVLALFLKLAADRSRDDEIREHAERCWHDRDERHASATRLSEELLGLHGLGTYLEGCMATTWTARSGWLEVPTTIFWGWEPGLTFDPTKVAGWPDGPAARNLRLMLTRAQVRHGGRRIRDSALAEVDQAVAPDVQSLPRRWAAAEQRRARQAVTAWIDAKNPSPHGRKSLFTEEWWRTARWVYEIHGLRTRNVDVAAAHSVEESYLARRKSQFLRDARLEPIRVKDKGGST